MREYKITSTGGHRGSFYLCPGDEIRYKMSQLIVFTDETCFSKLPKEPLYFDDFSFLEKHGYVDKKTGAYKFFAETRECVDISTFYGLYNGKFITKQYGKNLCKVTYSEPDEEGNPYKYADNHGALFFKARPIRIRME